MGNFFKKKKEEEITTIAIKLIVLGEGRVGKQDLLKKYFKNKDFNSNNTINPAFYEKTLNFGGNKINFAIWDTAGQEQFNATSALYYQNAYGALLVYDLTIFETFMKIKDWVKTLKESVGNDIVIVIVGNKFDLVNKEELEVHKEKIENYCREINCKHFYVSDKTGYNIQETFDCLFKDVLNSNKYKKEYGEPKILKTRKERLKIGRK